MTHILFPPVGFMLAGGFLGGSVLFSFLCTVLVTFFSDKISLDFINQILYNILV